MDETTINNWHQRMDSQQRIVIETCQKALAGEMGLTEAAEAIIHSDPKFQEPFSSVYPEAQILSDLAYEVAQHPGQQSEIEAKYREECQDVLRWLLAEFSNMSH